MKTRIFAQKSRILALALAAIILPLSAAHAYDYTYDILQISLVPGMGMPSGSGDAAISLGFVGAINDRIDAIQLSNVFNVANEVRGLQASGVFNVASRRIDGVQLGGVFNIGETVVTPFQGAGVFNIAHDLIGFQVAGVFNVAGNVHGLQAAGAFNIAGNVRGLQIGFVNVADRVDGLQIGLLNFSSNGISDLGVVWNGADGYVNTSWKTGRNGLYFVYGAGSPQNEWFPNPEHLTVSAGIGGRSGSSRSPHIDLDIRAEQYIGPDHVRFAKGIFHQDGLRPADVLRPYPSVNLSLGIPLGPITLVGGAKIDVNLAGAAWMPASLQRGIPYSATWLGLGFTSWTKFFFGFSI